MIRRLVQSTFNPNFARITRRSFCSSSTMTEKSTPFAVCYVMAPDETIAKKLSHEIVEKKLAACVNIVPQITSIYSWEGKINEDPEVMMVIKTRKSHVDDLSEFIRANHPYSVAEVISMPIENGNPPYLEWMGKIVPEK